MSVPPDIGSPASKTTSTSSSSVVFSPLTTDVTARPAVRRRDQTFLSVPDMKPSPKFNVLIAANGEREIAQAEALTIRFSNHPRIETKAIVDTVTQRMARTAPTWPNIRTESSENRVEKVREREQREVDASLKEAYDMCEWADILVLAPINAHTMAMMLNGMTGNMMLEVLRSWDVSKKIIMIPGMTKSMWENPMTRKQLFEVRTKWNWVRVMHPILWSYDSSSGSGKCIPSWTGTAFNQLVEVIQNQADLMTIGHDVDDTTSGELAQRSLKTDTHLPPEIWSIIFQYVGDWETAVKMRVWTNLPTPDEWKNRTPRNAKDPLQQYQRELEWTILLSPTPAIIHKLSQAPRNLLYLSSLSVKLIIKFSLIPVLSYLSTTLKDVFWASFGSTLLPTKASAAYGRPQILEWWRTSPSFLKKDYTSEAIDGASKSGFVHVLDWWHKSGLPLKYTEAALEQASSKGHILVLEWWKEASTHQGSYFIDATPTMTASKSLPPNTLVSTPLASTTSTHTSTSLSPLRLKVGKSIVAAAQNGHASTIRWWDTSGIPYSHTESVCKIASAYGHVEVLEEWKRLKGEKFAMSFDNQVLVGPTKNAFVCVLEWWRAQTLEDNEGAEAEEEKAIAGGMVGKPKSARLRVEYKTCDIEEALEDCVGSAGGEHEVRKWWGKNGLNLGVGTSEWMQVKTL